MNPYSLETLDPEIIEMEDFFTEAYIDRFIGDMIMVAETGGTGGHRTNQEPGIFRDTARNLRSSQGNYNWQLPITNCQLSFIDKVLSLDGR